MRAAQSRFRAPVDVRRTRCALHSPGAWCACSRTVTSPADVITLATPPGRVVSIRGELVRRCLLGTLVPAPGCPGPPQAQPGCNSRGNTGCNSGCNTLVRRAHAAHRCEQVTTWENGAERPLRHDRGLPYVRGAGRHLGCSTWRIASILRAALPWPVDIARNIGYHLGAQHAMQHGSPHSGAAAVRRCGTAWRRGCMAWDVRVAIVSAVVVRRMPAAMPSGGKA